MGGWILTVRVRVEQQEYLPLWHVVSTLHFPALQHKRDPDPAELKVGAASPHPLSYRALTTARPRHGIMETPSDAFESR